MPPSSRFITLMFSLQRFSSSLAFFISLAPLPLLAVAPTIDPFTNVAPDPGNAAAFVVPVGKTLVVPVSVTNPDETALTFSVTSSDPKIEARVKTGNPILRLRVKYDGQAATTGVPATPAFEGDIDLQLYRDLAPVTSGFIAGFAQAGYYNNLTFHRVIKDFVVQTGDPAGTGNGFTTGNPSQFIGLPFNFEHEFQPSLIFSGIGQLAMANSAGGYNRGLTSADAPGQIAEPRIGLGDFSATNGSQVFITTSNQHNNLDFKHTIFGQVVRGWDILNKLNTVPVGPNAGLPPQNPARRSDQPSTDVKLVSATVLPGRSEATILLGARGVASATIKLFVEDSAGNKTTSTFIAAGKPDPVNSRPVMGRLPTGFASLGEFPDLFVNGVDLEQDRTSFGIASVRQTLQSTSADFLPDFIGFASIVRQYGTIGTPGVQTFAVGISSYLNDSADAVPFTDPNREGQFAPFASYNWTVQRYVIGKKPVRTEAVTINATAATAGTFVVAKFSDTDLTGTPATYSAQINWGDGTALSTGTVAVDSTRPGSALFTISGGHTYAQPGIYTATAILNWNIPPTLPGGAATPEEIARVRSGVFVAAGGAALRAQGVTLDVKAPKGQVSNRVLANFTDTNRSRRAVDYLATVDWGDGALSRAVVVKTGPGRFAIRGNHKYRDPETFALNIRIHPVAAVNESSDAVTWSTLNVSGFTAPAHAAPFPIANMRATWRPFNNGPENINKVVTAGLINPYVPANLQVQLNGQLEVNNSGNKASAPSKIRAYLSNDATLTTTGATADVRLKVNGNVQISVGALGPGVVVNTGSTPWLIDLPKGESGGRKFLITEVVYSDPIVDVSNVPKFSEIQLPARIFGFDPSSTTPATSQDGVTKFTFRVVLDTLPTANVTIPVVSSTTTQGTVFPSSLTFTAANYNVPQLITVTGVQDNNPNSVPYSVTVGPSVSTDSALNGIAGPTIQLNNRP